MPTPRAGARPPTRVTLAGFQVDPRTGRIVRALEKDQEAIKASLEKIVGALAVKPASAVNSTDLSTAESVVVWTHDLSAVAGETYR